MPVEQKSFEKICAERRVTSATCFSGKTARKFGVACRKGVSKDVVAKMCRPPTSHTSGVLAKDTKALTADVFETFIAPGIDGLL